MFSLIVFLYNLLDFVHLLSSGLCTTVFGLPVQMLFIALSGNVTLS